MLVLYNTLAHKKERFRPIEAGKIGMYACGITAYYSAHIGNMRTYVQVDLVRRLLIHDGYELRHVQNITDVGHLVSDADTGEDKLRLAAEREHKSMREVSNFYNGVFLKEAGLLNVQLPEAMPRATDHIPEMIALIQRLDEKGYIYRAENGMYFDTSKFKDYGQLTGMTFDKLTADLKEGARVEKVEGKRNITDFAVWRFAHGDEKEMVWDTQWGRGFPGWHIECSAMSMKYLGEHFDIHLGGVDHIAIHHTNEIAQSEAATGKKFVNYWMHMEFLTVNGSKMSKSLRNIYTVQDVIGRGHPPLALRLFLISGHYRQTLNFTFEALGNVENTLKGVYSFLERVSATKNAAKNEDTSDFKGKVSALKRKFFAELNDDINTPSALANMHAIINEANARASSGKLNKAEAKAVINAMLSFDEVLGLKFSDHVSTKKAPLGKEIADLIKEREEARKAKDFKRSDEIRNMLREKYGVILEDTKDGVSWHRIS